ncbi:MAG TPA: hypothetical protein PLH19_16070 [Anaerolineae bacterium]|nr:hypothetical protein [Anaerolineae bacterium]
MKNSLLTTVALTMLLGLVACEPRSAATSILPTPVSVIPTATPLLSPTSMPTAEPSLMPTDTPTAMPSPRPTTTPCLTPTPGGPVWRILFKGAPCSEMLNPGCQPFDGTPSYLYAINSDGTDLEKIEIVPDGSSLVRFSPGGTRLAYIGPDNGLYLAEVDGARSTTVLDNLVSFDFSPDGEYIYYSSREIINDDPGRFETQANIGRIRIDGSGNSILATLPTEGADIQVSPDGNWVLARGFARDHVTRYLYVIRTASGETRELFSSRSMGAFHWSEEGQIEFWVYEHEREGEADLNTLYVVDVEGQNLYPTFTARGINSSLDVGDWSPDGEEFAFMWGDSLALLALNSEYWCPILSNYSISMGSVTSCGPRCPW